MPVYRRGGSHLSGHVLEGNCCSFGSIGDWDPTQPGDWDCGRSTYSPFTCPRTGSSEPNCSRCLEKPLCERGTHHPREPLPEACHLLQGLPHELPACCFAGINDCTIPLLKPSGTEKKSDQT